MKNNSNPIDSQRTAAIAYLSEIFSEIVCVEGRDLLESENLCIEQGHSILAQALSMALERYDCELCANLPDGIKIHDRRNRTLATKLGDVRFSWHTCRDTYGSAVIPLADALDIQWGARISPAARVFLVDAAAEVSYIKSASLLTQAGGSCVSATSVMNSVHRTGQLCAEEDTESAESLYCDGVIPKGECQADDICIESDGTWIKLQGASEEKPKKIEIKALVSYAGKQQIKTKTARVNPVRHGCVGTPEQFWTQSVATLADRFDLSKIENIHFGCDGESFYKEGAAYLPISAECDTHLDPFHVNRAILSCFYQKDKQLANNILGVAIDGDVESAAALIEACENLGIAKKDSSKVANYLRTNADIVYSGGPSLGTMESEQQHVYGARMDSIPCGWSVGGADAMARIRSRKHSKRKLPRLTRDKSITPKRARRKEKRELDYLSKKGLSNVPKTVGHGNEAEHTASIASCSANVRYAAGIDSGMISIG